MSQRTGTAPDLRRQLFWMILAVVLLDAAAIGVHRWLDMEHRPFNQRMAFTVVWTLATLAIVLPGLARIRAARLRARRARRP